jgi:hypothetical protein
MTKTTKRKLCDICRNWARTYFVDLTDKAGPMWYCPDCWRDKEGSY